MSGQKITEHDLEKLKELRKFIMDGTACSYDKMKALEYLNAILEPKCAVCRKIIEGECFVSGKYKMHEACSKRYKKD